MTHAGKQVAYEQTDCHLKMDNGQADMMLKLSIPNTDLIYQLDNSAQKNLNRMNECYKMTATGIKHDVINSQSV